MQARAFIGFERRRQIQVRMSFVGGMERAKETTLNLTDFYLACGDYLVFSLIRLDEQDQRISDLLRSRVSRDVVELHDQLDVLDARQVVCRQMTNRLRDAVNALAAAGPSGVDPFEKEAEAFISEFTGLLAPRRNPLEPYTDEYFTDHDWVSIVDATDDACAKEDTLYMAVQKHAPEGLDPSGFTAQHGP